MLKKRLIAFYLKMIWYMNILYIPFPTHFLIFVCEWKKIFFFHLKISFIPIEHLDSVLSILLFFIWFKEDLGHTSTDKHCKYTKINDISTKYNIDVSLFHNEPIYIALVKNEENSGKVSRVVTGFSDVRKSRVITHNGRYEFMDHT